MKQIALYFVCFQHKRAPKVIQPRKKGAAFQLVTWRHIWSIFVCGKFRASQVFKVC